MLSSLIIRNDSEGKGFFGAPRGSRLHYGVDYIVKENQSVLAPFEGVLVRKAYPDGNDLRKEGFVFLTSNGLEFKVFYAKINKSDVGKRFKKGDVIAKAQSVSNLYNLPNMKDHIHVEVRVNGMVENAELYLSELKKKISIVNIILFGMGLIIIGLIGLKKWLKS